MTDWERAIRLDFMRFILKQWGNMYVANDPNKKLHCEYRFVKNLDNQLKQAIKESKE